MLGVLLLPVSKVAVGAPEEVRRSGAIFSGGLRMMPPRFAQTLPPRILCPQSPIPQLSPEYSSTKI